MILVKTRVRCRSRLGGTNFNQELSELINWLEECVGEVHTDWNLTTLSGNLAGVYVHDENQAALVQLRWA